MAGSAACGPHAGSKLVGDHNAWVYFAEFFGFDIVAYLESLPGILPTTKRMGVVIELMKTNRVKVFLEAAYYDPRYAQFGLRELWRDHRPDGRTGQFSPRHGTLPRYVGLQREATRGSVGGNDQVGYRVETHDFPFGPLPFP